MNLKSSQGVALYVLLIFAVCTFISLSTYLFSRSHVSREYFKERYKLQALLNARSGIWYGLSLLNEKKGERTDSLSTRGYTPLWGEDLFESIDTSARESLLIAGGEPLCVTPFDSAAFGYISIALSPLGLFQVLNSEGVARDERQRIRITIGSKPFQVSDTVLYLSTPGDVQGPGGIDGRVVYLNNDSGSISRLSADKEECRNIFNVYRTPFKKMIDSLLPQNPLLITDNDALSRIPDTVYGPLFIDGTVRSLALNDHRRIFVCNDLQLTGALFLVNITFVVNGDIKVLDEVTLSSAELIGMQRIFFAGTSRFSGNAMAGKDIEIYSEAAITEKSILVGMQPDTARQPNDTVPRPYSFFIRDKARVDGVCIDLNRDGGIRTDPETTVRGILFCEGRLCLEGEMNGVVRANSLVDSKTPMKTAGNYLSGRIRPLSSIGEYVLPYFIGACGIIEWREMVPADQGADTTTVEEL